MTAHSACSRRWYLLAVLFGVLLVSWSCSSAEYVSITPATLVHTSLPASAGAVPRTLATPARPPATGTPQPTPAAILSPTWTVVPSPMPTTIATTTPLSLSWVGPLIVPAEVPDPAENDMVSFIPIFDVGSGQSAQLPLMGFSRLVNIRGWSADGCFLIVSGDPLEGEGWPTYLVNVATGMSRLLVSNDASQVMFSPDGKWIAYWLYDRDASRQWVSVVRADGSAPAIVLAEGQAGQCGLTGWTDDSHKLLYWVSAGDQTEEGGTYAVDMDSLEQCLISRQPHPLERWEDLYLADVASCERIPLPLTGSLGSADSVAVDYVPGSPYIALFPRDSGGGGDFTFDALAFLMMDIDTGEVYTVSAEPFLASNFWAWSPDGTALVLEADFQGDWGVYLVEAATGQKRKLDVGAASAPSWSPDGRLLAFHSLDSGPFIYDLQTGGITYLPVEFAYRRAPAAVPFLWSPRISYGNEACR